MPAVGILRTVWLQQFQRTVTDGVQEAAWRGKNDLPPSRARITSPYDPDSRNAVKRGSAWDGYKVHFTETCDAQKSGRPHLITHVVTTDATIGDPVVVDEIHDRLHAKHLLPGEHLMDAGYISAELLLTTPSQRGVRVIGPVRPHTRHTVQTAAYNKTSFTIDWDARRVTCPNGAHSRYWTEGLDNNQRPAIRIRFATETCAPCPARAQCTSSTRYGRQLTVRLQDQGAVLERVRAEQATENWKAVYSTRSGVEGTIHQAVTATGARRTRYAGLPSHTSSQPLPSTSSASTPGGPGNHSPPPGHHASLPSTSPHKQLSNGVIESWYNLHRPHSSLGYHSPTDYEMTKLVA